MSFYLNNIIAFSPHGTIIGYLGSTDPDGWVICDGITRNVSDNRYANLVTMGIGTGNVNSYTPPDYRGAFLRGSNKGTANATATTTYGARAPNLKSPQTHMTELHSHTASSGIQNANHNHSGTSNSGGSHTHSATLGNSPNHTHGSVSTDESPAHTHTMEDYIWAENQGNVAVQPGSNKGYDNNNTTDSYERTTNKSTANHTHSYTTDANSDNHSHTLTIDNLDPNHNHSIITDLDPNHNHTITVNNSTTNNGAETRPYNFGVNWILKL